MASAAETRQDGVHYRSVVVLTARREAASLTGVDMWPLPFLDFS